MKVAPLPANEALRLEQLKRYEILDTAPEAEFDEAAIVAAAICHTPIAIVGLIDAGRQWYKAKVGVEATEVPREETFCQYALLDAKVMEVPDARKDPRFADAPAVTAAMGVRFYASAPLLDESGVALGTLCVVDHKPKELTAEQRQALEALARLVVAHMRLRIAHKTLAAVAGEVQALGGTASRERQDLVNHISHELRTPLTPMMLQLHVLRASVKDDDAGRRSLEALERNLARLNEAVGHVLAFTSSGQAVQQTAHDKDRRLAAGAAGPGQG
ncbi:MAG TPA: GAF domain-containing protein [Candidatus Thermoplasmatota archaeon]|nr:GAF domain-containing protein [Candidatus Thermoplasmatota archaeon]